MPGAAIAGLPSPQPGTTLGAMEGLIREQKHRLPPECYRGRVVCSFTIDTKHRTPFFADPRNVEVAGIALAEAFVRYHGHAGVYLFMPDHIHLILSGSGPEADLLAMVTVFKQKTAFRVHQEGRTFTWQKDFYDHIIRADEDYGAQVRYILRNPVRAGLCAHWEHWPHKGTLGQTWQDLALNIGSL